MLILNTLSDSGLIDLLRQGKIGVLPTDTVYGLVARAEDQMAVSRLYALKKRERKPGTLIAGNIDQLVSLGIKARYLKAVEQYWPNPVSVIIPCGEELDYIHLGLHGIAMRIPADQDVIQLLLKTGPLLTTSANRPSEPEAVTMQMAQDYFGEDVDFYVDGGDMSDRQASTVIRIIDDAVEVLRQGAVRINEAGEIEK